MHVPVITHFFLHAHPFFYSYPSHSFTTYVRIHTYRHKIARYNSSIAALQNLLLWWDSMTTVEQSTTQNIETLVSQGEAIINR